MISGAHVRTAVVTILVVEVTRLAVVLTGFGAWL